MPAIDESQIKIALSAVKDARRKYSIRQADLSERSNILTNQRAVEQLLASFLTKAGFEVDKFDTIRTQNQTELRRIVEKQNADALKHSSSVKDSLRYGVDSRRKTIEHLATLTPPPIGPIAPPKPKYVVLDSPFWILPTPGIPLDASHVEPWNSWAKFKLDAQAPSYDNEELSFYFLWENPSDRPAVINVASLLGLNGFCYAQTDGGYLPDLERYANLRIRAHLNLFEWWNQPPTQPLWEDNQQQFVLELVAYAGDFLDFSADFKAEELFRAYSLDYTLFLIPPNGAVVFEVTLSIFYSVSHFGNDSGQIHVDFTNGDREVMCPAVWFTILP